MVSRYSMNSIKTKSKLKRKVNIRASKKKLQTIYGYVVTHTDADTRLTLSSNGEETNLDCPHMFFSLLLLNKRKRVKQNTKNRRKKNDEEIKKNKRNLKAIVTALILMISVSKTCVQT